MTVLYSNDFEGSSHLATLGAFTIIAGSAFIVLDEGSFNPPFAPGGAKSYATNDTGNRNYWNGGSAIGDQQITGDSYLIVGHCIGFCLRVNSAASDECYFFYYEESGGNLRGVITKQNLGATVLATSSYNVAASAGYTVHMEARAVGSTLELRLWVNAASRPGTATVSATDSTYTTGRQGLRKVGANGTYANVDNLEITDAAGGGGSVFNPLSGRGAAAAAPFAFLREAIKRPRIFLPPLFRPPLAVN